MEVKGKRFKVIIRPNSLTNGIIGFDDKKKAYIVKIKAKPVNNKANTELIKFLSRALKKKVKIKSGLKSREKIIEVNI